MEALREKARDFYEAAEAVIAEKRKEQEKHVAAVIAQRIQRFARWVKKPRNLRHRLWKGAKYRHYHFAQRCYRRKLRNLLLRPVPAA